MQHHLVTTLLGSMLAIAGCSKENTDKGATAATTPAEETRAAEPVAQADEAVPASDAVKAVLKDYEAIRLVLVKDSVEGIAVHAQQVADTASKAARGADSKTRPHLEKIAEASRSLKEKATGDIAATRKAFGELSRHLVALLAADPALQKGLHIFECPMAEGYKKWVQPNAKLENPYMGQKMLQCGAESSFS
jgi:Cu(I)/Ag(I) efflux system membrane fusion protein